MYNFSSQSQRKRSVKSTIFCVKNKVKEAILTVVCNGGSLEEQEPILGL
jgi:hypothetical protein